MSISDIKHLQQSWGMRKPRLELAFGSYTVLVESGGFCDFIDNPRNGRHSHNYFEVCYVLSGSGRFTCSNKQAYSVKAGDIFLAEPSVIHEIDSLASRDLVVFYFSFLVIEHNNFKEPNNSAIETAKDLLYSEPQRFDVSAPLFIQNPHFIMALEAFVQQRHIYREACRDLELLVPLFCSNSPLYERHFISFCLELLMKLSDNSFGITFDNKAMQNSDWHQTTKGEDKIVKEALKLLNKSNTFPTVSELAKALNISQRHLHREFVKILNHSPKTEIMRQKMALAQDLLKMNFSVTEISDRLGISDPANFSRQFKSIVGLAPSHYQKKFITTHVNN